MKLKNVNQACRIITQFLRLGKDHPYLQFDENGDSSNVLLNEALHFVVKNGRERGALYMFFLGMEGMFRLLGMCLREQLDGSLRVENSPFPGCEGKTIDEIRADSDLVELLGDIAFDLVLVELERLSCLREPARGEPIGVLDKFGVLHLLVNSDFRQFEKNQRHWAGFSLAVLSGRAIARGYCGGAEFEKLFREARGDEDTEEALINELSGFLSDEDVGSAVRCLITEVGKGARPSS